MDRFAAWGNQLHQSWARDIFAETAIDVGYWQCGGVYIARTSGELAALAALTDSWREEQIDFDELALREVQLKLGQRLNLTGTLLRAVWTPHEAQVRNPDFLKGLRAAIEGRGARVIENAGAVTLTGQGDRVTGVVPENGSVLSVDMVCVAAGAWTYEVLKSVGVSLPIEPVRGQMVLFKLAQPLTTIVNEGSRYLVPRRDGYVLAGSTMEQVGFDCCTTEPEINGLVEFASGIYPELNRNSQVRQWAGLRPASYDGLPYIGFVPGFVNAVVAAGHLRIGLQTAPATAVLVADMLAAKKDHEILPLVNPFRILS
jgi:glycine oxidase